MKKTTSLLLSLAAVLASSGTALAGADRYRHHVDHCDQIRRQVNVIELERLARAGDQEALRRLIDLTGSCAPAAPAPVLAPVEAS